MKFGVIVSCAIVVAALAELLAPGYPLYHAGWFNVALVALIVLLVLNARGARAAMLVAYGGVVAVGIATVVCGLLAPDLRVVTGAPGQQVRVDELGATLVFPFASKDGAIDTDVTLVRPGRGPSAVGSWRNVGSFELRRRMRLVVYVEATDARGAHLTVTQPTGAAFLSPVLLMLQSQAMSGMNLPYDSFAVPAAHRIVKAVLFNAQQSARLRAASNVPGPAVLFAVDDDTDKPLPNAIALAHDGQRVSLGGVSLTPTVLGYPAVEVIATPSLPVVAAGLIAAIAGSIFAFGLTRKGAAS